MTTSFKLGLPTDIPWKRRCVTTDMIDRVVCDRSLPPKWQSSIALFEYTPPEEFQEFPDYDISYLKATVTITGYQALDDEIQGRIDWSGVDVSIVDGVTELLESYWPCSGAILQVVCGPHSDDVPLSKYPFFMDFEPKKRELYEMATDTHERQSRSLESLNVGTSSASTQSLEVLDVDMGGSVGFGAQASYAGTGGGFNFSSSNQGQWGTKAVNSDTSQSSRTAEMALERRETQSHTTQLSQMYHLLDSYHLGTNRAVFFVQPRPHVLEEPSGFVRGPRKVEGIQEFLLVVAKPKGSGDLCFSARLDTSHLVETDVLDYEYRSDLVPMASAQARIPNRNDTKVAGTSVEACFIGCWDVHYDCFAFTDNDDVVFTPPPGFRIVGYTDVVPSDTSHGNTSVTVAADGMSLTVHAEATSHICFEGDEVCVNCPDEIQKWPAHARRQVRADLRSIEKTRKVGTEEQLLITTRGLCCCEERLLKVPPGDIIDVVAIPGHLRAPQLRAARAAMASIRGIAVSANEVRSARQADDDHGCSCHDQSEPDETPAQRIRRVNSMGEFIRDRMARNVRVNPQRALPASFLETDLFAKQVEAIAARTRRGRSQLEQRAEVDVKTKRLLAQALGKQQGEVTRRDLLRFRSVDLARDLGADANTVGRLKLTALGLPVKPASHESEPEGDSQPEKPAKQPAKSAKRRTTKKPGRSGS